jgi:RHS repeat-associated protein
MKAKLSNPCAIAAYLAALCFVPPVGAQQNPPSQLLNISTRLPVQTGDNVLIGGFIVTGTEPKRVIIRAIGPSLAQFFSGALADPTLELHQSDGTVITNDNWKINDQTQQSQEAEIRATTIPPQNDLESAIVATLQAGAYTAIVRGKNNGAGIAVVEAYDLNQAANSNLANIATRGFVDTNDNVMIGGFIIGPSGGMRTTLAVRAIGPSLTAFGVPNALQDPTLAIYDANGLITGANDNWRDGQPAELERVGLQPNDPRESAVVLSLPPGNYTGVVRGAGDTTGVGLVEVYNIAVPPPIVIPDPVSQAPAPPVSSIPDFGDSTAFLYQGQNPIQRGVTPGTINPATAAVVRGTVRRRDDQPLGGVLVAIHGKPEFGYTFTRADGQYDLALNGGEVEHVDFEAEGYLPAQREVQVAQQDFAVATDVVLIPVDGIATKVSFGANAPVQVASSSTQTDAVGSRSATMYFPGGTGAQLLFSNGTTQSVGTLTIRATEYTVGSNGPAAMPATLPGGSAYTYCVALTADEASNAGANVLFDTNIAVYVDNYLNFPVGTLVPSGYYDHIKAAWVPADNGIVAKVLSINNGVANLDLDGDGVAESDSTLSGLGITVAERQQIASRFAAGTSFWRMPVGHFTDWDYNYPPNLDDKATPSGNNPQPAPPNDTRPGFGELGLASQVFKEELPIAGTKMSLHYASDRVPGYRVNATLELPLIGASIPQNLNGADVEVKIAGRTLKQTFAPSSSLIASFQWDGRDAYHPQGASSAPVAGSAMAQVTLAYRYPLSYAITAIKSLSKTANYVQRNSVEPTSGIVSIGSLAPIFALAGSQSSAVVHSGSEDAILTKFMRVLTVPDHRKAGLDGWSLTPHHFYDPTAKILYRGDGQLVRTEAKGVDLVYQSSPNVALESMAVAPNGDIYVGSGGQARPIYKITPSGQLVGVTAAPNTPGKTVISVNSPDLDNKLAADVVLDRGPDQIRTGPDGSIYLAYEATIFRLDRDERFHLVLCGSSGDQYGVTATDGAFAYNAYRNAAYSSGPNTIAIAKDGSVYFNDSAPNASGDRSHPLQMIRKIAPDGRIYTIAGLGGYPDDDYYAGNVDIGKLALTARMRTPTSIAIGPDDSVYYGSGRFGIVHIKKNGILELVLYGLVNNPVGIGDPSTSDEGQVAATAGTYGNSRGATSLQVVADGTIYFQEDQCAGPTCNPTVWKIDTDGILRRVGGRYFAIPLQTGNALEADLGGHILDLGFGPDGSLYLVSPEKSDGALTSLRKVSSALPGFNTTNLTIASEDGQELYVFDQNGRHLRTTDTLLNVTTWMFTYDSRGFLASVQDRDGLITTIERDSSGHATAIVGPYGARTALAVDSNGYLATITAPDQTKTQITNSSTGLLNAITGPRQDTYSFTYDDMGRLTRGNLPTGGFTTLARSGSATDATITATSAAGRVETRRVQRTPAGGTLTTLTNPDEVSSTENHLPDGSRILNNLPSFQAETDLAPDPRPAIAGQGSYLSLQRFTTPSGLKAEITSSRQATLSDPSNPLSLTALSVTTSYNGKTSETDYDAATRSSISHSAENRSLELRIDSNGKPNYLKAGSLATQRVTYDSSGRGASVVDGEGASARTSTYGYDANGYRNFVHLPDGRETQITNDVFGRATSIVLPGNRTVGLTYDVDGRLESVTPPGRPSYTFQYDVLTGRVTYKSPDLPGTDNTTLVDQTPDRQLKSLTLPGGRHVDISRNPSGKISGITDTFGDVFSFSYNTVGQISGINQPNGQALALSYTGPYASSVTWSGGVTGSIVHQLNNDLQLNSESVNNETPITFGYDKDGLMTSAGALTIVWRSDAALPVSTQIGQVSTSGEYDDFGLRIHTNASYTGTTLLDIKQTPDSGGRVASRTEDGNGLVTNAYTYNTAGFLASITRNGVVSTYTYDTNGNITNAVTPGGSVSYTYDARDRLLTAGTASFTYADAGEMKTRTTPSGTTSYSYDEFGELRHVVLADGRVIDYDLGTTSFRIGKKTNGVLVRRFLRDIGGRILAELDAQNVVVNRFVYATTSAAPSYLIRGTNTFGLVTDETGSVRVVVDITTGAIAQRLDYDEWGNVTLDTNPGFQPFGFGGGIYDADTGLVRFGARDYDPATRRWMAPDSIGFLGASTNLYTYANNDPVNLIDPSGFGPGLGGGNGGGGGCDSGSGGDGGQGDEITVGGSGVGGNIHPLFFSFSGSIQIVADKEGNIGLQVSGGAGTGPGAEASVTGVASHTTGNIYGNRGFGTSAGFSGGAVLAGGADVLINADGKVVGSQQALGAGVGGEGHVEKTYTVVVGFNASQVEDFITGNAVTVPVQDVVVKRPCK